MISNVPRALASAATGAATVAIACGATAGEARALTYEGEPVVRTTYDEASGSDLLTAGLGVAGIQSAIAPQPVDPLAPTAEELRTIAIYNNTRALVDVTTAGGYGRFYGPGVPHEPGSDAPPELIFGDEFLVFSDRGATQNDTMRVQVTVAFDPGQPCIVTGASSGSRGVYGAVGTSGEWGLKRGCAVAYTDKGTGTGAHDLDDDSVNLIRGERGRRGGRRRLQFYGAGRPGGPSRLQRGDAVPFRVQARPFAGQPRAVLGRGTCSNRSALRSSC